MNKKAIFTQKTAADHKKGRKKLSKSNRCQQLWDSYWVNLPNASNGVLMKHRKNETINLTQATTNKNFAQTNSLENALKQDHCNKAAPSAVSETAVQNKPAPTNTIKEALSLDKNIFGKFDAQTMSPPNITELLCTLTDSDKNYLNSSPTLSQLLLQLLDAASVANKTHHHPAPISPTKTFRTTTQTSQVPSVLPLATNVSATTQTETSQIRSPVSEAPINLKYYTPVSKQRLRVLEQHKVFVRRIKKSFNIKQYHGTPLGRRLHAMAMLHAPKVGVETMEKIISLLAAAFAANIGIDEKYLPDISKISPSSTTLKQLLVDLTVESVLLTSEEVKGKNMG